MLRVHPEAVRGVVARATRRSAQDGRNLGRIRWQRRALVLACPVVVPGLTTAHVFRLTPKFEAATLVRRAVALASSPDLASLKTSNQGPWPKV
jgi:uncharacterized protein involved in exopolysaccharide biosynthesis